MCVEISRQRGMIAIRSSRHPDPPWLLLTPAQARELFDAIKARDEPRDDAPSCCGSTDAAACLCQNGCGCSCRACWCPKARKSAMTLTRTPLEDGRAG